MQIMYFSQMGYIEGNFAQFGNLSGEEAAAVVAGILKRDTSNFSLIVHSEVT